MPPLGHSPQPVTPKNLGSTSPRKITLEEDERVKHQLALVSELDEVKSNSAALLFPKITELYTAKGLDINQLFLHNETRRPEIVERKKKEIQDKFLKSQEHSAYASFAELLPLLANKPGRLGPYISARVTKTAKPDDAGNSFVDLVFELKNEYLKTEEAQKDKQLRDVRPSISFAVDVTTSRDAHQQKEKDLLTYDLSKGEKANVLAYEQRFPGGVTKLGIDVPKCLVLKDETSLADVANKFKQAVQMVPGKGFMITDEKYFDSAFKQFFDLYLESAIDSAVVNIEFLDSQKSLSEAQKNLRNSYQSLVAFYEAYKKTPTTIVGN